MNLTKECKIINLLTVVSIFFKITPAEAGGHKKTGRDFENPKYSRKIKNRQADQQLKKQEEYKKNSKLIPYVIAHSYNLDFTTPKGIGVGLLLATYVLPAAAAFDETTRAYLKCKQGNYQKFQTIREELIQKELFQNSGSISGLVIGHDASIVSSEARTELFQWAAKNGAKTLYMADAPNAYAQEILTDIRQNPKHYASIFEEENPSNSGCKQFKKNIIKSKKTGPRWIVHWKSIERTILILTLLESITLEKVKKKYIFTISKETSNSVIKSRETRNTVIH